MHGADGLRSIEPSQRQRVDSYMLHWSTDLVWRKDEPVILMLAYYRILEGCHFGEWLIQSVPDEPFALVEKEVEIWLSWLLIDYWQATGRLHWMARLSAR